MDVLISKLRSCGWLLRDDSLHEILENKIASDETERHSLKQIEDCLLKGDIRCFGQSWLKDNKADEERILQIDKIRDVTKPKCLDDEGASCSSSEKSLLRLTLTDGATSVVALAISPVNGITSQTSLGGKIKVKTGKVEIERGIWLLNNANTLYLGGSVDEISLKHKANEDVKTKGRAVMQNGAPPWVPFGTKLDHFLTVTKDFSSLSIIQSNQGPSVALPESFEHSRSAVIAKVQEEAGSYFASAPAKTVIPTSIDDSNGIKLQSSSKGEVRGTYRVRASGYRGRGHRGRSRRGY